MSDHHALRLGGATAFLGGVLTFVGNVLHPREPGQLDSAANLFSVVLQSEMWAADHLVIAIGLALLLHGFYGLTRSIHSQPGAAWGRLAWHMAILGVVLGIALMPRNSLTLPPVADSATCPEQDSPPSTPIRGAPRPAGASRPRASSRGG